jgi:CRP/FNR family transcriptional regulator, cyclic AMP receptor protein
MNNLRFNVRTFLAESGAGRTRVDHRSDQVIFSQGDRADSIFYVKKGRIKLSVVSKQGKIAVIAILWTCPQFWHKQLRLKIHLKEN